MENPLPVTVAELTVTPAVPLDDRVSDCVAGALRFTFPKAMLVALMLSSGALAVVPLPLSPITSAPFAAASLAIISSPVAVPVDAGEKLTLKLSELPAATVIGRSLAPLTVKACPARLT